MWHAFWKEGQLITPAQPIKLSMMTNISTGLLRRINTLADVSGGVLNYAREFEEAYNVPFVEARFVDILKNMMSSNFLAASSKATYVRQVRLAELMIGQSTVLPLIQRLRDERSERKTLEIAHLQAQALYTSEPEDFLLLIEAADLFVKNDSKTAQFHYSTFYPQARSLMPQLHSLHSKFGSEEHPTFVSFKGIMIQQTRSLARSFQSLFLAAMRPFDHEQRDHAER